jgi:stage V sporulation protein T
VIDVFNDILEKKALDRTDLQLIIDRIIVYDDHIDVKLKADVDAILQLDRRKMEESMEVAAATEVQTENFDTDSEVILTGNGRGANLRMSRVQDGNNATMVRLKTRNQLERLFAVNIISSGDPLEIFTNRDGGIILKKYSPVGELGAVEEYVEAAAQVAKCTVCVADRERVVAAAGPGKREFFGKRIHPELTECMERRENVFAGDEDARFCRVISDGAEVISEAISTIVCEGDVVGAVILLSQEPEREFTEMEEKLAVCGAKFLEKQMET